MRRVETWEEKGTGYPLGKMRVQVGRVVNIETEENVEVAVAGSSMTKVGSQSTEDLVERERERMSL